MRGDSHPGFAFDIRRISSLTSGETRGLPGLVLPLVLVQCARERLRCQAITVRGCTSTTTARQRAQTFESHAQNSRSTGLIRGRVPDCW